MKFLCIGALVVAFSSVFFGITQSDDGQANTVKKNEAESRPWIRPWMVEDTSVDTDGIVPCEALPVIDAGDIPQSETSRERMVREVVTIWEMFFEDDNASIDDSRRERFDEFAEYLVDAVLMYQENPTDIGGQLPVDSKAHLLLATMVTVESSVTFDVVGRKNEVGLLQIHGKALGGHKPAEVQKNPRLGLILGVRWLAAQIPVCFPDGMPDSWSDDNWVGPLSLYAGGPKAFKAGKCLRFRVAKSRIAMMKQYETRLAFDIDIGDRI